jgi:hypothetical protein
MDIREDIWYPASLGVRYPDILTIQSPVHP